MGGRTALSKQHRRLLYRVVKFFGNDTSSSLVIPLAEVYLANAFIVNFEASVVCRCIKAAGAC